MDEDNVIISEERYKKLLKIEEDERVRELMKEKGREPIFEVEHISTCLLCGNITKQTIMSKYLRDLRSSVPKCIHCKGALMMLSSEELLKRLFEVVDRYEEVLLRLRKVE